MKDLYEIQNPLEVTRALPWVSSRYHFLSTKGIVDALAEKGWELKELNFRNPFGPHQLRFERKELGAEPGWKAWGTVPQIVFYNSFDGQSSARAFVGVLRQVCSNGLVAWKEDLLGKSRHNASVKEWSRQILENFECQQSEITRMIWEANENQASVLFKTRLALRILELRGLKKKELRWEPESLLLSTRPEDEDNTVWNLFKRAQERAIRGFHSYGPITEPKRHLHINLELWKEMRYELRDKISH